MHARLFAVRGEVNVTWRGARMAGEGSGGMRGLLAMIGSVSFPGYLVLNIQEGAE